MILQIPITTAEYQQVISGETSSIIKLESNHLNRKLREDDGHGKDIEFEEITAVCSAGQIPCKPRVYRSVHTSESYQKRPVVVFRKK